MSMRIGLGIGYSTMTNIELALLIAGAWGLLMAVYVMLDR